MTVFTLAEREYLLTQPLGRLATMAPSGVLHNNPVGFRLTADDVIEVWGRRLGASAKFKNAQRHPQVSFVVDDLASVEPWRPRMIEVRGIAETVLDADPPAPFFSREVIRIRASKLVVFGVDPGSPERAVRTVD